MAHRANRPVNPSAVGIRHAQIQADSDHRIVDQHVEARSLRGEARLALQAKYTKPQRRHAGR